MLVGGTLLPSAIGHSGDSKWVPKLIPLGSDECLETRTEEELSLLPKITEYEARIT